MVNFYPQLKFNYADGDILYAGADLGAQSGLNAVSEACGNGLTLMYATKGTTSSKTEVELATKTFTAGDFAATDAVYVYVLAYDDGTSGNTALNVRVNDGSTTKDCGLGNQSYASARILAMRGYIWQDYNTNTVVNIARQAIANGYEDGVTGTGMVANWITTAWTLSIRGNAASTAASPTMGYRIMVYRMRGA